MFHRILLYISKLEVIIPFNIIPWSILLSSINLNWAIITGLMLLIIGVVVYKYLMEIMPKFFLHCTVLWIVANYAIYEFVSVGSLLIFPEENRTTTFLMVAAIFCIYQAKRKVWKFKNLILGTNKPADLVKYCNFCEIYTPADAQHKFWINTCVIPTNKLYYLFGSLFGFLALLYTSNLILITLCEPVHIIKGYYLPKKCNGVYYARELSLSFISAVYQTLFAVFLLSDMLMLAVRKICRKCRK